METSLCDLPPGVLEQVAGACALEDVGAVAALAASCRTLREPAARRLAELRVAWDVFFTSAGSPLDDGGSPAERGQDDELVRFIASGAPSVELRKRTGRQRKWLHTRAESLGLQTETVDRVGPFVATVRVTRPDGWVMPATPAQQGSVAPRGRRRRQAWVGECDMCGVTLDAWEALYHYSGMGPFCDDCIEGDDYLAGLKWETR